KSEIVLMLLDASSELDALDYQILQGIKNKNHIIVFNKCDLPRKIAKDNLPDCCKQSISVTISALTGKGLSELHSAILEKVYSGSAQIKNVDFFLNVRQQYSLEQCLKFLEESLDLLGKNITIDIIAEDIHQAIMRLDEISGRYVSEEILNKIFSRFCVGK
ncbi:MAG TPA: hypothetical protein PKX05_03835, partial [bacterium]|nr:hypothetical protein [bacterium]